VIARPFTGRAGGFARTPRRKDLSLKPPSKTVLDYAIESGLKVFAVGKIAEIFAGCGITESVHTDNNVDTIDRTLDYMKKVNSGMIFANLVDFDMLWGHRNDAAGYARGLEDVDRRLPEFTGSLHSDDILVFTADHGCDPTTPGTDHTREYVPLLVFGERTRPVDLGTRQTFSDLGKTVADLLGFKAPIKGTSFAAEIVKG
jgi:phosphopentomutase